MMYDAHYFEKLDNSRWPVHLSGLTEQRWLAFFQKFLATEIVKIVARVNNLDEFLELLAADKSYFPWIGSNGAIRAAQVVAVAGQTGLEPDFVRAMLEPRLSTTVVFSVEF